MEIHIWLPRIVVDNTNLENVFILILFEFNNFIFWNEIFGFNSTILNGNSSDSNSHALVIVLLDDSNIDSSA